MKKSTKEKLAYGGAGAVAGGVAVASPRIARGLRATVRNFRARRLMKNALKIRKKQKAKKIKDYLRNIRKQELIDQRWSRPYQR